MASGIEAFSLYAKLILDSVDYEKGLNAAESKAHSIASGVGHGLATLGGAAGKAVAGLAKATATGVAAASAGVVALTKAAVSSYADYEQLVGGVQTLFGLGGQSLEEYAKSVGKSAEEAMGDYNALIEGQMTVLANADNAYKTAGLSANEYMETVTSFSAALIASLDGDTAAAANKADMAITDMSDNANKMGSSMESIQNAYQGFAKQNYTMLDNLKLGYGGTKEEMQRLLKDAEKLSGQKFDLTSYSDIVDAIHVVQTEMGITGTTAKEATETISGSLNMAKAAWQNLVTGLADSQYDTNIKALVENLVNSIVGYTDEAGNHVKGVLDNILPAVEAALEGIATLIGEAVPKLVENLPTILNTVLPVLIEAAINLVNGLVAALPTVIQLLLDQIPMILDTIIQTVVTLAPVLIGALVSLIGEIVAALPDLITQLTEALPELFNSIGEAISQNMGEDGLLGNILQSLLDLFLQIGQMIAENLPSIMESITNALIEIANVITDPANLENFINTAIEIINALVEGLTKALPQLIPAAVDVILALTTALLEPDLLFTLIDAAVQIIVALAQGLIDSLPVLLERLPEIIEAIVEGLIGAIPLLIAAAVEIITKLCVMLTDPNMVLKLIAAAIKIIAAIVKGLIQALPQIINAAFKIVMTLIQAVIDKAKQLLELGKKIINFVKEGIHQKIEDAKEWGKHLIQNFIDGIMAKWEALKQKVASVAQSVKSFLGFSEPEKGPLSDFHTYAPDMMELFMKGIEDNQKKLQDTVANAFNFQPLITSPEMGALGSESTQTWNINIYQPMESAADVARAIREESQYGLIGGDSLAT